MDKNNTATETNVPPIATEEVTTSTDDAEARIAALEAEKATILEREANYKMAYLKEKSKNVDPNETDEERIRRITREEMSNSRISQIDTEKENYIKKLAKENKELKLAQMNKTSVPASMTSSTDNPGVRDTLITPEQMATFKAMKWTDKEIERYKKNLVRYGTR